MSGTMDQPPIYYIIAYIMVLIPNILHPVVKVGGRASCQQQCRHVEGPLHLSGHQVGQLAVKILLHAENFSMNSTDHLFMK